MKFSIDESQNEKLNAWFDECYAIAPINTYTGAAGGRFTYSFTPVSLGLCVQVHDNITGKTIDVTDSENW